jgi:hypothetical protein
MTATTRPRTPWALLALASLLGLLGPAGAMGPTDAAAAVRLAATAPPTDGQAILGDRVVGPRAAADRRDQRDRPGTAPAALAGAAAGAEPPAAGAVHLAAGGRGRPGRQSAASPRGPPPLPAS